MNKAEVGEIGRGEVGEVTGYEREGGNAGKAK